jgi:sugar phosphate isomerase/epimerase
MPAGQETAVTPPIPSLRLGTTLFSFTNEYHARRCTVEQLIDRVAELGLGPGLEILGFSHIREYPQVSNEFVSMFRRAVERNNLEPSCLSMNCDVMIHRTRPMTLDESYEYHKVQIETAAKLGLPVAKTQVMAGPRLMERLAPLAEKLGVKVGVEIHTPESVDSPNVMAIREVCDRIGSPYLGFVPDFGASVSFVPACFTESFRERGIRDDLIQIALDAWASEGPFGERIARYQQNERAAGAADSDIGAMFMIFGMLGRQDPKKWLEIMPQVLHIHAKFYDAREKAIDFDELLPLFRDNGFDGYLASEWEGHAFTDEDAAEQLVALHERMRRTLADRNTPRAFEET